MNCIPFLFRHTFEGCNESLKVYLNGELLPDTFEKYLELYETNSTQNNVTPGSNNTTASNTTTTTTTTTSNNNEPTGEGDQATEIPNSNNR